MAANAHESKPQAKPDAAPEREPPKPSRGTADGHAVSGTPLSEDEQVTEALEESFPASDPPSYVAKARVGSPRR